MNGPGRCGGWFCRRLLAAAAVAFSLSRANGATPPPAPPADPAIAGIPLTAAAPAELYVPPENTRELLKVDNAMRRFFAERITADHGSIERLHQIVDAIVLPGGLHFTYDPDGTFDAREAFRQRRGNCVGFSLLMVAVAREFGFDAEFQNVAAAIRWGRFGEIVVSILHVNVCVHTDDGTYVVDLRRDLVPNPLFGATEPITDRRAFAEFYCDIGFSRLVHRQPGEALPYMTRATELDPGYAGAWVNRANLHVRLGDLAMGRTCFERAVHADRRDLAAVAGLIDLLKRTGSPDDRQAAEKLEHQAQWLRSRNPYIQQRLATLARDRGDWTAAEKFVRRAVALKDDEPEFYEQWIATLRHLGRETEARRIEGKLEKLRVRLANMRADFGS